MSPIDERYPDLRGEGNTPDLETLIADLDAAYNSAAAPMRLQDLRIETLRAQAGAFHGAAPRRHRWLLIRRRRIPLLLAAALVVVAALAGVAHALESLVDQDMSRLPGTGQIVSQDLGRELNLSQSACGFSLTIDRVYADVNRVVVGYSVSGPAGRRFFDFTADLALTDNQGRALKVTSGPAAVLRCVPREPLA